jgi:Glycosyl hydrolases family 35
MAAKARFYQRRRPGASGKRRCSASQSNTAGNLAYADFGIHSVSSKFARRLLPAGLGGRLGAIVWATIAAFLATAGNAPAQIRMRGVMIVSDHGYPELRVDGAPFFLHAASFDYARIPRDQWDATLDRYLALGINTVDLRIPWNWHETLPGVFDFDGHTNPRRDLRGLLRLVAAKNLHLIARMGPAIGNYWRNAGLPEWVTPADRARDEQEWLTAVARELAPYQAGQTTPEEPLSEAGPVTGDPSPPLLFVVLQDDGAPERASAESGVQEGMRAQKQMAAWRAGLRAGGLHGPLVLTPIEMEKDGWAAAGPFTGSPEMDSTPGVETPLAAAAEGLGGRWFFHPPATPATLPPGGARLGGPDVTALSLLSGVLAAQARWPPLVIALAGSGHAPADDSRAVASAPSNLLLASRLLVGRGVRGIEYAPLEDTLTPAGWSAPTANRYLRFDAPLGAGGEPQEQIEAVRRNAWLLDAWGAQLASSHLRADFGLIVPGADAPQTAGGRQITLRTIAQIERVAEMAGLTAELLDPQGEPVERLLNDSAVLLDAGEGREASLSPAAQSALVEYVRRGGTLICFPQRPAGNLMAPLWEGAEKEYIGAQGFRAMRRVAGRGSVVVWTKDFYSWVDPSRSFQQSRAQFEASWAITTLRQLVAMSGKRPVIELRAASDAPASHTLLVSELAANDLRAVATGRTAACAGHQLCAAALVSATNLDWNQPSHERVTIESPALSSGTADPDPMTETLDLTVPPHDSLLLPVHAPLCEATLDASRCPDEVVVAGAELLSAEQEGKTLELAFYTPARATVVLRLRERPGKIEAGNYKLEGKWTQKTHRLEVSLPRGASPDFLRLLKIDLPYEPEVQERVDLAQMTPPDFTFSVANAVKLPLAQDVSLASWPSLVVLDPQGSGTLLLDAHNDDQRKHSFKASVGGAVRGNGSTVIPGGESGFLLVKLQPDGQQIQRTTSGALLRGELQVEADKVRKSAPLAFLTVGSEGNAPPAHYRFDFDRDGNDEWVVENRRLRLILSPFEGGQAMALVEVTSNLNLFTTVGALRDAVVLSGDGPAGASATGFPLNQGYSSEWIDEDGGPAVRLSYHSPASSPYGVTIEKTVRLSSEDTVEASYRFTLNPSAPDGPKTAAGGSLLVTSSVPAEAEKQRETQFCWESRAAQPAGAQPRAGKGEPQNCMAFRPSSKPIQLPESTRRIEIHTPGKPGLALAWSRGRLTIAPKNYSAELQLRIAAGLGDAPNGATVSYTMLTAE